MEMSPTNECIAHPFSGLRLQASRLTYVAPAHTPQSPLSDGSNGRVRVIRDDKLASLFVSGCVVYELDAKPGANLHVMDEFEVVGVCKSHTIKPSMDALPGVIVEPLAEDVGEAEDPESSGDDITGGMPAPNFELLYKTTQSADVAPSPLVDLSEAPVEHVDIDDIHTEIPLEHELGCVDASDVGIGARLLLEEVESERTDAAMDAVITHLSSPA